MPRLNSLLAPTTLFPIADSSAVGDVRRFAQDMAKQLGFDETRAGSVSIVATELSTNIIRHAGSGSLLVQVRQSDGTSSLNLLAIDRGPGMRDVARCLEDGYSTRAGGAGTGLGAIRRLADAFDILSGPGTGTAVLARFGSPGPSSVSMLADAISLPYPGETACGDAWMMDLNPESCSFAVVDGLGHGVDAARAAAEALRALMDPRRHPVREQLELMHEALRHTRGAALAIADVHPESHVIRYAGIGNIVGATASMTDLKRMVSMDGTLGHDFRLIREFDYSLGEDQLLIMHSDGLRSQWQLDPYPGLLRRDPLLIAGILYRDYSKGNDDVTVLVARGAVP